LRSISGTGEFGGVFGSPVGAPQHVKAVIETNAKHAHMIRFLLFMIVSFVRCVQLRVRCGTRDAQP
jgi:hypothetical protein